MSYCRFAWNGSDVYVFDHVDGGIECCGCRFGDTTRFGTPEEAITHLGLHRRAGHFVPEYAITRLWADIPGADKPVNPEPPELTKRREMIDGILKDIRKEGHDQPNR